MLIVADGRPNDRREFRRMLVIWTDPLQPDSRFTDVQVNNIVGYPQPFNGQ